MTDLVSLAGLARSLAIYYGRPWRIAQMSRFYADFVRPGDIAFDIGAHVGNRSRALVRAGAHVVALEPQDLFYAFLKRTLPSEVVVLQSAAGARSATGTMSVSRLHPTVSTTAAGFPMSVSASKNFASVAWDRTQPVETTTLDMLIARYGLPVFVKIDVEGSEFDVLAGLSRPIRTIAFEFLPATQSVAQACIRHIETLGSCDYNVIVGEKLAFELPQWVSADDVEHWLSQLGPDEGSGDIYARLR